MASKSVVAFLLLANLALFAFVSTNAYAMATPTCPDLNVCLDIANSLVNVRFGSQSRSQCCQLLAGVANLDAALCLCTSLKTTTLGPVVGGVLGLLNSLVGNILDSELLVILNSCGLNPPTNYHCA